MNREDFLTPFEARQLLRCNPDWISRQMDRGTIRYRIESLLDKGTTRYWLVKEDVEELVKQRNTNGTTPSANTQP